MKKNEMRTGKADMNTMPSVLCTPVPNANARSLDFSPGDGRKPRMGTEPGLEASAADLIELADACARVAAGFCPFLPGLGPELEGLLRRGHLAFRPLLRALGAHLARAGVPGKGEAGSFGLALEWLRQGRVVRRRGGDQRSYKIASDGVLCRSCGPDGFRFAGTFWYPAHVLPEDMLADDWEVLL